MGPVIICEKLQNGLSLLGVPLDHGAGIPTHHWGPAPIRPPAFQARPAPGAAAAAFTESLPGIMEASQAAEARRPQVRRTQRRHDTRDHGLNEDGGRVTEIGELTRKTWGTVILEN